MANLTSRLVVSMIDRVSGPARRVASSMRALKASEGIVTGAAVANVRRQARTMRALRTIGGYTPGLAGLGATAGALGFLRNEQTYQDAMNRTQAILNVTDEKAFKPHRDLIVDLAKKYPATSAEIAKGASELAMSGMSLEQVNSVLEASVQGAMASGESIKTVGQGVTDVVMGLGKELNRSNFLEVNNTLAAGATSYAEDYQQLLAGLAKTAPLARVTGTSLRDVTAMLGMLANAGFKAEKGGTALRTMMIRMGAPTPKAMAQLKKFHIDLETFRGKFDGNKIGGENGANQLVDMLFGRGLDATKASGAIEKILGDKALLGNSGKLRKALLSTLSKSLDLSPDGPTAEMLAEEVDAFIAGGFSKLDVLGLFDALGKEGAMDDIQALADIFGVRFAAQGASLMASKFTKDPKTGKTAFDAALDTFTERIPGAVERFAKILMQGLPGAIKRLASAFDALLRTMASKEVGAFDTIINAIDRLRDGLIWLSERSPGLLKGLTLSLFGLGMLAPIGLALSAAASGLTLLGAVAGGAARGLGLLFGLSWASGRAAILGIAKAARFAAASLAIFNLAGAVGGKGALLASGLTGAASAVKALGLSLLSISLTGGAAVAVLAALAGIGAFIYQNWQGIGEFFSGFADGFMEGLGPAKGVVQDLGTAIGDLVDWIWKLTGPIDETGEKWHSWGKSVGEAIATPLRLIGELIECVGKLGGMMRDSAVGRWIFGERSPAAAAAASLPDLSLLDLNSWRAQQASTSQTSPAQAAASAPAASPSASGDVASVDGDARRIASTVDSAMSEVKRIVASVDLESEGRRIGESLARGIRSSISSIRAAAQDAAAAAAASTLRGAYSDAGR